MTEKIKRTEQLDWFENEGKELLKELNILYPPNHPTVILISKQLEEIRKLRTKLT